jgi:benzoate-CoA ligase family protein
MTMELDERLNIADFFLGARIAEGLGEHTALVIDRMGEGVFTHTYNDVARAADRFAHALAALGVEPEQRVLIALPDGLEFVAAFFGTLKLGAVVVMVNPELKSDEASYLLSYTRAKVAVVGAMSAAPFQSAAEHAALCKAVLVMDEVTTISVKAMHYGRVAHGEQRPFPSFASHRDDAAIWLFSGGTTGLPKAVVQTHGAFVNTTRLYGQAVLGMSASDLTLSVPKLYFGYATGSNLLFPFSVGARSLLFPERVTAERLFELIERHRPSVLIHVPTMIGKMLDMPGSAQRDLSSLRVVTSAGEALPEALHRRWHQAYGTPLLDGLGTAEMWHVFLSNFPDDVRPGTLGKVVPGFEVKVCDDDGQPLADGEVGWLWVRGKSRALGYFQQHDKSCQAFRGEWYVSGDMVKRASDGVFTYEGRGDDMLKVSGKWLAPREVESCLCEHPLVEECAVVGVSDDSGLIKPCAFVRAREPRAGLGEELKTFVRERLAPYKAPREVVFLHEFPRTHLGKIDRGKLRNVRSLHAGEQS